VLIQPSSGSLYLNKIVANGEGGGWWEARDKASIARSVATNSSTYYPIFSVKTYQGDWSAGTLGDGGEYLYFAHRYDTNHTSGNNSKTRKYRLPGAANNSENSTYNLTHALVSNGSCFTSGQLVVADGTQGALKTTGNTISGSSDTSINIEVSTGEMASFIATNSKGSISLDTTSNRGVYDVTNTRWLIATDGTDTIM
jgi:hypothetical protein